MTTAQVRDDGAKMRTCYPWEGNKQELGFESRDYTKGKIPTTGVAFPFSRKQKCI